MATGIHKRWLCWCGRNRRRTGAIVLAAFFFAATVAGTTRADQPAGSFTLAVAPALTLETGQQGLLAVHVRRDRFDAPITIRFTGLPAGVTITPEVTIASGESCWKGAVTVSAGARARTAALKVRAHSGGIQRQAVVLLTITRAAEPELIPVAPERAMLSRRQLPVQAPAGSGRESMPPAALLGLPIEQPPDTPGELFLAAATESAQPRPKGTGESALEPAIVPIEVALPLERSAVLPPIPAIAPATDRWFFMKALQGTAAGAILDANRLRVSGWIDSSYTVGTDQHSNLPMTFNYIPYAYVVQQNWLRVERLVVSGGTSTPSFGFRSDTILPGTDYFFTLPRGIFNSQLTANNGRQNRYGIDPVQFYAEAYFPTVGLGMDVKVGRFFAQFGVESIATVDNPLLSHAYTFNYNPFTQTGIVTTTKLTDAWSVQAGLVLGNDIFIAPGDNPTGIADVRWAPPSGNDMVQFAVILDNARFDQKHRFHNPDIFDFICMHKINSVLTYTLEALYGFTSNVPNIGLADWIGVPQYLTYTLTPRLSTTTRLELYDDFTGQRTGFAGLYTALTSNLNFALTKSIIFRPELRFDYNIHSRPFEDKHGLFTAASDVIIRW